MFFTCKKEEKHQIFSQNAEDHLLWSNVSFSLKSIHLIMSKHICIDVWTLLTIEKFLNADTHMEASKLQNQK